MLDNGEIHPKKPRKYQKPRRLGRRCVVLKLKWLPDNPRRGKGWIIGKNTGLSISMFLATLFDANERLPPHKKMNDETLRRAILDEFEPGQSKMIDSLRARKLSVRILRARYNQGEFTCRTKPGTDPMGWLRANRFDG